jgi:hypothetical protein
MFTGTSQAQSGLLKKNDSMCASVDWASGVAWREKKEERPKKPIGDPIDREMKRSRRKNENKV